MTVEASMIEFAKNQQYGYEALFLTEMVKIILI